MTFFNPNLTEHSDAAYYSEQSGPSMPHFAVVAEVNLYSLSRANGHTLTPRQSTQKHVLHCLFRSKFSKFYYNSQTDKIDDKI